MTTSIQPLQAEEQRVILPGVTWQQYDSLLATLGDYPGLRLIYLEGTLEIFMPSPEHSQFFPNLDLQLLAQFVRPQEQPQAIKEFLQAVRS